MPEGPAAPDVLKAADLITAALRDENILASPYTKRGTCNSDGNVQTDGTEINSTTFSSYF